MKYFQQIVMIGIMALVFTAPLEAAEQAFMITPFPHVLHIQLRLPRGDRFDFLPTGQAWYTPKVDEHQGKDDTVNTIVTKPSAVEFSQIYRNLNKGVTSFATSCNEVRVVFYTKTSAFEYQVTNVPYVAQFIRDFSDIEDKSYVPSHVDYTACKL